MAGFIREEESTSLQVAVEVGMHARESREHLDRKQEPKINDPFTQNADIWREEGREE